MKRFFTILTFLCLVSIPLLAKELIAEDKNGRSFDVLNSAYSVGCLKDFGYAHEPIIEFSDGEWESQGRLDSEIFVPRVWISEYFIADLVKESPGKEVIAEFHCNDGGETSSFEVQVFNGETGDRLGSILTEFIEYLHPFPSAGQIALKTREWRGNDPNCCHSSFSIVAWKWGGSDWMKVSTEIWEKHEIEEKQRNHPPNHDLNQRILFNFE